jgi:four helix bundle protein
MAEIKFAFEDLKGYKKTLDFIDLIYAISSGFRKEETYRSSSRFIRAATTIALNRAEGSDATDLQFSRFQQIAVKESVVRKSYEETRFYPL